MLVDLRRARRRADHQLRQCHQAERRHDPAPAAPARQPGRRRISSASRRSRSRDFIRIDEQGRGIVNILAADKLMASPKLYATFLLWLLSELFEALPEVGDPDKPKLVFFFDEAHLLFDDAPKALLEKIEQVVRLIRSKGVGVYFITQNPIDIPEKRRRPARQPGAARAARLHPARPDGDQGGGRDLPHQSRRRRRDRDHRIEGRRGAGLAAAAPTARPRRSSAR